MSLLDSVVNAVVGGASGNGNASSALLTAVIGHITNQPGGIGGFLSQLQQGGLGDAVASWVGTGQNQPVSGSQIGSALGTDVLQQLAQHVGGSSGGIADQLAQMLPHLIDHATPSGAVPTAAPADLSQQLLGALPGLLAKLA